jgi:hypothetical protein
MTRQNIDLSPEQLRENLQSALKQWSEKGEPAPFWARLGLFQQALQHCHGNAVLALTRLLEEGLTLLALENERHALLLRLRFVENRTAFDAANQIDVAESSFYLLQRTAIQRLAELLYQQEIRYQDAMQLILEQRLEAPTYTDLVGIENTIATLLPLLRQSGPPWLIALEGMGGMGKTALANALARQIIAHPEPFVDVGWVTARQARYDLAGAIIAENEPALHSTALIEALWQQLLGQTQPTTLLPHDQKLQMVRSRLKQQPHLIVIDNLETLRDVESLLPLLQSLLNPTKFLLTSRLHFGGGSGVYHFTVPPLSAVDALRLVRQEARISNLTHLVNAPDEALREIYATVGGNPLALRLVVGQAYVHALGAILDDLKHARGARVEQLYTYLYRWAWERLDEPARLTWLAMPLVAEGNATVAHLGQVTDLDEQPLRAALDHLVRLNLVNCQRDLYEPCYTIHNLTRTFLQEQIARWS